MQMRLTDLRFMANGWKGHWILALATFAAWTGVANAAEPTTTVVEFHNAALDQFFVTASPAEAATLAR